MKTLMFLIFSLLPITSLQADTYKDYVTYAWTVDGTPAPSCELVSFRVQEWARREAEAEEVFEWYSPVVQSPEQRSALMELVRRMPFFLDDRLYEHLVVKHEWRVDLVETEKLRMSTSKLRTTFKDSKRSWTDPYNGTFPADLHVEVNPGRIVLRQKISFQRYCLGDPQIELRFETPEVSIVLQAENDVDLLSAKFTSQ